MEAPGSTPGASTSRKRVRRVYPQEFSLFVTRWNPKTYDGATRDLRIYLRSRKRDNPAPVMLRREDGVWKIYSNSL